MAEETKKQTEKESVKPVAKVEEKEKKSEGSSPVTKGGEGASEEKSTEATSSDGKKETTKAKEDAKASEDALDTSSQKKPHPKGADTKDQSGGKVEISKKDVAVARGKSYPISRKHSQFLCAFLKGKTTEQALHDLGRVLVMKQAVPFKGEIPHRKGPMMSGRYPVKAAEYFVNLVKALRGNILVNQMDLEKSKITLAVSSWAHRPSRRGNRRGKRTHVTLEAREVVVSKKKKADVKKESDSKKGAKK